MQNLADQLAPLRSELLRPFQRERLCVVLADDRLDVLVVRQEDPQLRLLAWLEAPLPPGISRDGAPELGDALGDLLGDLLLQGNLPLVPGGAAVVSAAQAPVRTLLLPPDLEASADPDALRDWLRQHQDRLPPLQDQEIALEPLPLADGWAFACLPRPVLDRWLLMFAAAGLELHGLEPELCACRRALVGPLDPPAAGCWNCGRRPAPAGCCCGTTGPRCWMRWSTAPMPRTWRHGCSPWPSPCSAGMGAGPRRCCGGWCMTPRG